MICPRCDGKGHHPGPGMEGSEPCSLCKGKKNVSKSIYEKYKKVHKHRVVRSIPPLSCKADSYNYDW
jgi:DnaJ-class molecular chaperone